MTVSKESGFKKVAGIFDSGWKIIIVIIGFVTLISSVAVTLARIKDNAVRIDHVDATYKQMIQEMIRDSKQQLEEQHEMIHKNDELIDALREDFNNHEISSAEFRGRVKAILKIN